MSAQELYFMINVWPFIKIIQHLHDGLPCTWGLCVKNVGEISWNTDLHICGLLCSQSYIQDPHRWPWTCRSDSKADGIRMRREEEVTHPARSSLHQVWGRWRVLRAPWEEGWPTHRATCPGRSPGAPASPPQPSPGSCWPGGCLTEMSAGSSWESRSQWSPSIFESRYQSRKWD